MRINPFTAEAIERCPVCKKATKMECRWPNSKKGITESRIVPTMCDCEMRNKEKRDADIERMRQEVIEKQRYLNAFGDRVIQGGFENSDGRNAAVMQECAGYVESFDETRKATKNGIMLWGETRAGKTFAAEAIAHELHRSGKSVLMDTAAGFVQRWQHADRIQMDALRHRIATCDILVVDDFGVSRDTSFGREAIFSVIDGRITAKGPMIVTTNITPQIMATASDVEDRRVYFRILERCIPLKVEDKLL